MAKQKNDYFQMMEQQVACCVEAAGLLEQFFSAYTPEGLKENRDRIHAVEHRADDIYHDILRKLSAEFITPIDQEDILHVVQLLDDVTVAIDEVDLECYMFHIIALPEDAMTMCRKVNACVQELQRAIQELKNFKKPEKLREHLVGVNTIESEADEIYTEAIHNLFLSETDGKMIISAKNVYDSLEKCCDLCEFLAETIEQIIIKNT